MILSQVKLRHVILQHNDSTLLTDYSDVWYDGSLSDIAIGFIHRGTTQEASFEIISEMVKEICGFPVWWKELSNTYYRLYNMKAFL